MDKDSNWYRWLSRGLSTLVLLSSIAQAQLWNGVLDPTRAIDWTYAGIPGGIPTTWPTCTTAQAGRTIPLAAGLTTAEINSALTACHNAVATGVVVTMAAGTTTVTTINIPAYTVLRGAGADQTILNNSTSNAISIDSGGDPPAGGTSCPSYAGCVTSGATSGSTSITVNNAATIAVGNLLHLTELNATGVTCVTGSNSCAGYADGWYGGTRLRGQTLEVIGKSGNVLTIRPPLYSDYPNSPLAVPYAPIKYAGVENLQIHGTSSSGSSQMIWVRSAAYFWVRGVEINMINGTGNSMEVQFSLGGEIRDNYFTGAYSHVTGGGENEIAIDYKTSGTIIENNIIERMQTSIDLRSGSSGNILSYNYVTGSLSNNHNPPDEGSMGAFYYHNAHDQYNLAEGNVLPTLYPDSVFGSSYKLTFFRNWAQGINKACSPYTGAGTVTCSTSTWPTQGVQAVRADALSTQNNWVGNVVGSDLMNNNGPSPKVAYAVYPSACSGSCGWGWGQTTWNNGNEAGSGTGSCTTAFYTGNFTYVGSIQEITWSNSGVSGGLGCQNTTGIAITLPASFFHAAKPSWWGTLPWPSIGYTANRTGWTGPGGYTYNTLATIPAMACFTNVMHGTEGGAGGPYTFNADTCYSAVPPTQYTVTASKSGTGTGTLTSTPGGINCGATCAYNFDSGTSVTINQSTSNIFGGWAGTCGCTGTGLCSFTLNASCTVTAAFFSSVQSVLGGGGGSGTTVIGTASIPTGPDYSGLTISTSPIPLPNPIPSWGTNSTTGVTSPYTMQSVGNVSGANTVRTPTDFNRPIVRLTDLSTSCSNGLFATADNGEPNLFAADDSWILVKCSQSRYVWRFDPVNMTANSYTGINFGNNVQAAASHTEPTIAYTLSGTASTILSRITINAVAGTYSTEQIYDFSNVNCLANSVNGYTGGWTSSAWTGQFTSSGNDSTFAIAYSAPGGSQGGSTALYVAVWKQSYGANGGCDVLNTGTGEVWSHTGTDLGTITNTDRFKLHEAWPTMDNNYVVISTGSNGMLNGTYVAGYYIWQIGTLNMPHCGAADSSYYCDGHEAHGYLYLTSGKKATLHSFSNPATPLTQQASSTSPCTDMHMSWNYNPGNDSSPIVVTSQDYYDLPSILGGATPPCTPFNEILLAKSNGSGIMRAAHTFNSGWNYNFGVQNSIGVESSSGKFVMFASDGYGQFGSDTGSAHCNIGGPHWSANDSTSFVTGTDVGSYIMPTNNAAHYVYHVKSCSSSPCATGPTQPTWPQNSTAGTTVAETAPGNITWETAADVDTPANSAVSNCASAVMVVRLSN